MRRKTKYALLCTLSAMSLYMAGITGMAEEETEAVETEAAESETESEAESESDLIAIPYGQEGAWDKVAMTNDDAVKTGINIRATANEDGEVIGFLYRGGAAWVINKGETWTELCSGDLTGFVKNEYLLYGHDVTGLADHYGLEGVATTWDDVKLFAEADGGSDVVKMLETGESFPLVEDNGHWLEVQFTADDTAYLSEDDVTRVILLETAISKDGIYRGRAFVDTYDEAEETYTETEAAYTEPTYTEPTYTEPTYTEPPYTQTEAPQTEAPQTEAPQTEAPQTEAPQTEAPQTEAPQTEAPQTDAPDDDESDGSEDNGDLTSDGYYDADTGTYIDGNGNVVDSTFDAVYDDTDSYAEDTYTEDGTYTEDSYAEETESYVEETEAYVEETGSDSDTSGTDDTSLLAALIYCEAGNQSYDGMVAVGAVVMNRVYSSSFPNTISDVIYQSGQFTPASSGALSSALANGVPSTCYDAAAAALGGENPVGNALYFNTGSGQGTKIGDHQFY